MANTMNRKGEFDVEANWGETAKHYARQIAFERVTGRRYENGFTSQLFDRGHEYEPIARELYEEETFNEVKNGGFTELGVYGDSSDGLIGDHGCVEIKVAIEKVHWDLLESGGYDTKYKWQIQGHIWINDRDWCDFVRFCPEFHEPKRLCIYRVYKNTDMIEQLMERLRHFNNLIKEKIIILEK